MLTKIENLMDLTKKCRYDVSRRNGIPLHKVQLIRLPPTRGRIQGEGFPGSNPPRNFIEKYVVRYIS